LCQRCGIGVPCGHDPDRLPRGQPSRESGLGLLELREIAVGLVVTSRPNMPYPSEHLSAVDPGDRDEIPEQQEDVHLDSRREEERRGLWQGGTGQESEYQHSRDQGTTKGNLPELFKLAVRVGDEGDAVPTPP
jgi:hypothetical protein